MAGIAFIKTLEGYEAVEPGINNVTEKDLEGFFRVTSVINKLIADKEIYKETSKKAV